MRWCGRGGRLSSSSGNDSARYLMMSSWRTTPTRLPVVVDQRDVAVATGLHQLDRVADRLVEVERLRLGVMSVSTGLVEVDLTGHDAAEDVALGQHADEAPVRVAHEDRIAGPVRWIARTQSARVVPGGTVTGWRRLSTREPLVGHGRHAAADEGFGRLGRGSELARVGHVQSVDGHPVRDRRSVRRGRVRELPSGRPPRTRRPSRAR